MRTSGFAQVVGRLKLAVSPPLHRAHRVLFLGDNPVVVEVDEASLDDHDLLPFVHHSRSWAPVLWPAAAWGLGILFTVGLVELAFIAAYMGGTLGLYAGLTCAFLTAGAAAVRVARRAGLQRHGYLILRKSLGKVGDEMVEGWRPVTFEAPYAGIFQPSGALYETYDEPLSSGAFERAVSTKDALIKASPLLIGLGICAAVIFFLTQ